MRDEVVLFYADNHESFLNNDTIILGLSNQACPKYPNDNFPISFQYLKENRKNEVDFLLADKHQIFPQIDTIILDVCG